MSESQMSLPRLRWGILGAGTISSHFVKDLVLVRSDAPVRHVVQAVATLTLDKGKDFVDSTIPKEFVKPTVYTEYNVLYADEQVDIIYIGLPHSFHKDACLAAIKAGKHVLCEKPLAINLNEAEEEIAAARSKGVFLMEAVWTRFLPAVKELRRLLHQEKVIGHVSRMFCDFSTDVKIDSLPATSRLKDLKLGGGVLLDLGIYPLTLSNVILDGRVGDEAENPEVASQMTVVDGIDYANAIVVKYPGRKSLGILTTSFQCQTQGDFCRIDGSEGSITLSGPMAAKPTSLTIARHGEAEKELVFDHVGVGFYFEADAIALDITAGRLESEVMPLAETARMLKIMDDIRRVGGIVYPQDLECKVGSTEVGARDTVVHSQRERSIFDY